MSRKVIESMDILDNLIIGHVDPHIYAFTTNTIPNHLKIGDTYRPVQIRLKEWEKKYPKLEKKFEGLAIINKDIYFRDFSVHQYLLNDLNKSRLLNSDIADEYYYSNEFFKDTNARNIEEAIEDIKRNYEENSNKYTYYNKKDFLPSIHHYTRGEIWSLRPNQQDVVNKFIKAYRSGRTNLLMYAVMRFGKSFTSLCCGLAMGARLIVVVSAKADVQEEWKKTVESAGNFKEFVFLNANDLDFSENKLKDTLSTNKAVVFLTLQDLQGSSIKTKHKEVFENDIDLLIIDETHFGARAESFGAVIREKNRDFKNLNKLEDEFVYYNVADKNIKVLKSKVKIHLSGTPYRILLGSEFEQEDIISFVQFSDIVREKNIWDEKYLLEDEFEEWDNPYYGFPQMIRFAFSPNKTTISKLNLLKKQGTAIGLSKLFEPVSINEDRKNYLHREFKHKKEILNLLQAIDGKKDDENIFPFLNYGKIKQRNMCKHIVMVLPYCASCDAMEKMLIDFREKFKNLCHYEIVNISGLESHKKYKKTSDIKNKIKNCEKENIKTITLTVNRMLTGSTIEEWDTMIFLKDTSSPQEYDQAIFRLQNQYIRTLTGDKGIIKENMKPQTLLIDFNPHRLFVLQEQKALIFNTNNKEKGNLRLKKRLEEELEISPIVMMSANQIKKVEATDILSYISKYNSDRSISDETTDIPIDMALLNNAKVRNVILNQADFNSKGGLSFEAHKGKKEELELQQGKSERKDKLDYEDKSTPDENYNKDESLNLRKKFQTYYQRILFYSFLSKSQINSLDEILDSLNKEENMRIFLNLGLQQDILQFMKDNMESFVANSLDYKIQNISNLAYDKNKQPIDRALTSLKKFNRLSESEIITPKSFCDEIINNIPIEGIKDTMKSKKLFIDVGSKAAEFPIAIYKKLQAMGYNHKDIRECIYAIPTSSAAYELTRKFYEILDLNTDNIASQFNSYDLMNIESKNAVDYKKIKRLLEQTKKFCDMKLDEEVLEGSEKLKFGVVVGNPPYNVSDGGAQASSRPIYHHFVMLGEELKADYTSFVIPTRWFAGGKGLEEFRKYMLNNTKLAELHDITTPEYVFPNTNNRGGICYILTDSNKKEKEVRVVTHQNEKIISDQYRMMLKENIDIFVRDSIALEIIEKVRTKSSDYMNDIVSSRKPFGIESNIVKTEKFSFAKDSFTDPIVCVGKNNTIGYVNRESISKNQEWIKCHKVYVPRANNIGTELPDDNLNSFVGKIDSVCTEAYIVVGASYLANEDEANNLSIHLQTKFSRFLHKQAKASHDASKKTYQFIPLENYSDNSDINWMKSKNEIDEMLFKKYNLTNEEKEYIRSTIREM